jgi:hypothetical protein
MVMKDAVADGYTVLEVQEVSPNFFIHPIGKISTPLTSVAIVGDMVMGLFGTPDASVLYAYTIANPKDGKKLSTLPARQSPYYLLP